MRSSWPPRSHRVDSSTPGRVLGPLNSYKHRNKKKIPVRFPVHSPSSGNARRWGPVSLPLHVRPPWGIGGEHEHRSGCTCWTYKIVDKYGHNVENTIRDTYEKCWRQIALLIVVCGDGEKGWRERSERTEGQNQVGEVHVTGHGPLDYACHAQSTTNSTPTHPLTHRPHHPCLKLRPWLTGTMCSSLLSAEMLL